MNSGRRRGCCPESGGRVPAGLGIDITDPGVKTTPSAAGDTYGGIEGCDDPCISPLHTHDPSGVLHTESTESGLKRLGEFFTEWGVRLDEPLRGRVLHARLRHPGLPGRGPFRGDPATIELVDHREIAIVIVIGSFPADIPTSFDFGGP